MRVLGLTVFGCDQDEADAFRELSPHFGVLPTVTRAHVSERAIVGMPRNRSVSVSHKSPVTGDVLRALRDFGVEHLSTRSVGVDHIDLDAARAIGITVDNTVYAPDGVADFTVMLILIATRGVQPVVRATERHQFPPGAVRSTELRDLTVGVVGVGNIGAAVISRLRGFGCRVLACTNRPQSAVDARFVPLDDLLRESDVVTLHLPLDDDTHHLVGRAELAAMRPGAFLVNTGRGALVDTDALLAALECGTLGGAALDVLEGEDEVFSCDRSAVAVEHPALVRLQRLHRLPNVIVTPHIAYFTRRALRDTVEQTLVQAANHERSRACGDPPSRSCSEAARRSMTSR